MVHSANEACNILAHRVSGSVESFVAAMNARAAELGCVNTHFADPNGLSNEDHYTTAYEMYLITAEALRHPLFAEICNTKGYDMAATNLSPARSFYNSNALITADSEYGSSYVYSYAAGVKTGFTQKAGYCLISTAEKDGVRLLAVVMGCDGWLNAGLDEYQNFIDSRSLYEWAFQNFSYREAVSSLSTVSRVEVELAAEGDAYTSLRPQNDVTLLLPKDLDSSEVELVPTIYEERLVAPIEAGTILGRAEILVRGENCGSVNLINTTPVELSKKEFMSRRVTQTFSSPWIIALIVLMGLLAVGYLTLVLRYRAQRRKYLRRKRELAARRAARRSDPPLSEETTQRLNAIVDEEMQKKNRGKNP
jgi:D-alanyl-D-alanine carboxypeptidase (penicillin-binding protein 5/6)